MNIGVDLDGVLFDSERMFDEYSVEFDKKIVGKGPLHPEELKASNRFEWTKEQTKQFMKECYLKIEKNAPFMKDSIETLKKLKADGHKLFIITARGLIGNGEIVTTLDRLYGLESLFNKIFFLKSDKLEICKQYNIEVMIDDYYKTVEQIAEAGIPAIYFKWRENLKNVDHPLIKSLSSWKEVEEEINSMNDRSLEE